MKGKWIALAGVALLFAAVYVTTDVNGDAGGCMALIALVTVIVGLVRIWRERHPKKQMDAEERRAIAAEKQAEREHKRQVQAAKREALKDAQRKSHTIMEVKLLDGGSNIRKRAGLGGAVVGGMVAGPVGAVVGASMKKAGKKNRQRFAVRYADGHITTVEAEPGSATYNKLMKFVKWEEIK